MKKFSYFFLILFLFSIFYFLNSSTVSADYLNQFAIFNVDPKYEYESRREVSATLRKISNNGYWYVSDNYWTDLSASEQSLFLQKLDELAKEFDSRIYPLETKFWGSEPNPGIDNDPRITILVTRLVDYAGGYFDSAHLYKKSQVPESNEREMVFLNSISLLNGRAKIFLAHEFQHLIGLEQKDNLRNINEEIWLNEARAEYAPRLLGYDEVYENSNIRRRLFAFQSNPSDPLGEWKNESSDYGAIALFSYYLVDHYSERILADTLKSGKIGINSINEFLFQNGFTETFSDIFSNWTIANILNDPTVDSKLAYNYQHLKNFRISPSQSATLYGSGNSFSILKTLKDWQPAWYEFNSPVNLSGLNLKIDFSADSGTKFMIPYVTFKTNGQKETGFITPNSPHYFKNFGSDIYRIILIPANHSKTFDFTENDPSAYFTLKAEVTESSEFKEFALSPSLLPQASPSPSLAIQDLLDQISALQSQINQLQMQKNSASSFSLIRDLYLGVQGEDVRWLQKFLVKNGVYPEALTTGYFGPLTQTSVIRFQQRYGIFPQSGYVGAVTKAKIQELNIYYANQN